MVGKRILVRRAWRDLSQSELAAVAGVSRNFVSAIERGQQKLDAYRLGKLAAALDVSLADLLSDDDQHQPSA